MRSFASRNPSCVLFFALVPGLLLVEAGAPGSGLALDLSLAAAFGAIGQRRQAAALAVLACVLVPLTCHARIGRRAELSAWRSERPGPLVLIGRAEARADEVQGTTAYLFRVRARSEGGGPAEPRSGWVSLRWSSRSRRDLARKPRPGGGVPTPAPPPVGRDIRAAGWFRPSPVPANPGSLDWGSLAGGPRLRGSLTVDSWQALPGRSPLLQGLREWLSERIRALFPPLSGGFMQAALFGDRERLDPRLREVFSRTGTGHIVAISGMNVAILAALGWAVLTPFVASLRLRRRALAAALLLYVPLAGNSPSVARAAFMAAGLLSALGAARRVLLPNAVGAAGIALLALQPGVLTDPSFQLSFGAVLGLTALPELPGSRVATRIRLRGTRSKGLAARVLVGAAGLGAGLVDLAVVTLASLSATLPLTLAYFRRFPLLSVPANLVVVPALGTLTAGGFAAILASLVSEPLAELYARACDLLLWFVFRALELFARPAWAWLALPGPRIGLFGLGVVLGGLALAGARSRRVRPWAIALAPLLTLLSVLRAFAPSPREELEVAVLSVGQGDAIALLLPDGAALLIDGGPPGSGRAIAAYLHERGVHRLRRVFATHPDADHVAGLAELLREVPADSVHDGAQWGPGSPYRRFLEASVGGHAGYRSLAAGDRLRDGEVTLDVLWPPPGLAGRDPYWTAFPTNDASLIVLLSYRGFRLLLTGDAGGDVERRLVAVYGDSLRAGFLKVAHHGSRFSSMPELLATARPGVALLSVGAGNRYGHPSPEALTRIESTARVWRTDRDGALILRTDGIRYELAGFASGREEQGMVRNGGR